MLDKKNIIGIKMIVDIEWSYNHHTINFSPSYGSPSHEVSFVHHSKVVQHVGHLMISIV